MQTKQRSEVVRKVPVLSDRKEQILNLYSSPITSLKILNMAPYIHNWPLEPFSQDYGLSSHITHVMRVNFIHEWWGPTV